MADALRRTGQDALTRQHQINRQQEELDRMLKPLLAERTRVLAGRSRVVSVSITLDTTRDAEVRLSYHVNGPGWTPTYKALLDSSTSTLRLERLAQVAPVSYTHLDVYKRQVTKLAKWPEIAPTKAIRSANIMGSSQRCSGRGALRRRASSAS